MQGSSTAQEVWTKVKEHAIGAQRVLVLLDSHHSEEHVLVSAPLSLREWTGGACWVGVVGDAAVTAAGRARVGEWEQRCARTGRAAT